MYLCRMWLSLAFGPLLFTNVERWPTQSWTPADSTLRLGIRKFVSAPNVLAHILLSSPRQSICFDKEARKSEVRVAIKIEK